MLNQTMEIQNFLGLGSSHSLPLNIINSYYFHLLGDEFDLVDITQFEPGVTAYERDAIAEKFKYLAKVRDEKSKILKENHLTTILQKEIIIKPIQENLLS